MSSIIIRETGNLDRVIPQPKYVLYFWDGIGGYGPREFAHWGWHVWDGTAADSIDAAKRVLLDLARATYRETPTESGGPWLDVYAADQWDGISYGEMLGQITLGKRLSAVWTRA